jgi:hypothetical protein
MPESTTTPPDTHISNPWTQSKRTRETRYVASRAWHRMVSTNPAHCCSAFAHTPTPPTSLDSRCSAPGPEPEAPHNGQAIGSGQAAAPIHRIPHPNERPVGGAKIGHAEEPASAAGTALSAYYLLPPYTCWRYTLLAPGPPPCSQCPSRPPPSKKRGKSAHYSPHVICHMVPRWYLRKSKLAFWRNVPSGHYTGTAVKCIMP